MRRHEEIRDDLPLYASGDLAADEMDAIADHLEECRDCAQALAEIQGTLALLRQADVPEVEGPAKLQEVTAELARNEAPTRGPLPGWLRAAAVVLAFLAGMGADRVLSGAGSESAPQTVVNEAETSRERAYRAAMASNGGLARGLMAMAQLRVED